MLSAETYGTTILRELESFVAIRSIRLPEDSSVQDYHNLDVWHRGMDYAVAIYGFSRLLPSEERFNLVWQLR